ncbi:MAG: amidohydrolase, partial [Bacillota bacterium]
FAINLENAKDLKDIEKLINKKRKENPNLKLILGTRLTEFSLKNKKLPTKEDLDKIAPDIPVFLSSIEFHTLTVNSCALHKINLPVSIQGVIKDKKGIPTGKLVNEASIIARRKMYTILPEKYYTKSINKVVNEIVKKGVTSIIAIEGGYLFHDKHVDFLLKNKEKFPFDISILFSTTNIKKAKAYNFNKIGGDIFFDGSFRSQNAYVSKPYKDSPENFGKTFFTKNEMINFIKEAQDNNLQTSIHAVGDLGIEKLLEAYEIALKNQENTLRHKIEHFELPKKSHIKKAKKLGLILTMHPTYEYFFREKNGMYMNRLGKSRALKTNPFRQIFDQNIKVAGGSDSNVMPIDPLLGIHAAVNHPNPNSRINTFEALKMYTVNGAFSNFEEDMKGTLEKNKLADLVVLNKNPLKVSKDKLKDIEILYTFKNGKIIYKR